MPALPLDDAGPYVAAAYLTFFALVLVYVSIMAFKLTRIAREVRELSEIVARRDASSGDEEGPSPSAADVVEERARAGAGARGEDLR
jgi:hypothetical protein